MDILPNLLIVDDTKENLILYKHLLKGIKAHTISTNSGLEAIEKTQNVDLSLALIDVKMPLMNGYELAAIINTDKTKRKTPIIFITADQPIEADIIKGFEVGAIDFIVKPFVKQILVSKIEVFLELFKQRQENIKHQFRLEKTMEIGKIGTWEMNLKTNKLFWSIQNYKNFDLNSDTPITFDLYRNLIHPKDKAFVQKEWDKVIKHKTFDIEYRLIKGCDLKWIREKAIIEYDKQGEAIKAIGFTQDISDIKKSEIELQHKEAFNYAIFQYSPIPTIIVDNAGKIIDCNLAQKTSSKKQLVLGNIIYKEYANKHKTDMFAELMNCIKTQKPKTYTELKYKNKYLFITIVPFIKGAVITSIDITESKIAALKLEKARKELEILNKHQIDAREEERASMSMAIHDELGQSLTALKFDMSWLQKKSDAQSITEHKLSKMILMIDEIIKKVQRISAELRPGILDDLGLVAAIEWYCGEFEERSSIKCILDMCDEIPECQKTNLTLYRIFQEALTNILRHAKATKLIITLSNTSTSIKMSIEDNGLGMPKEKIKSIKSLGILGMQQRAKQCGGTIEIISKEKKGTKIIVNIPF